MDNHNLGFKIVKQAKNVQVGSPEIQAKYLKYYH